MSHPIVLVAGTRAEAIKLIPVYLALKEAALPTLFCATFQHVELLEQVCSLFNIIPDFNLGVMKENQDLFYLTSTILERTRDVYRHVEPSLVVVHGDTTTTLASALAAFYLNIPIAHIEAGMRTGNMRAPFPEEMNRKVVGQIASYHFAPTALSTANLLAEGVPRERVFCTGNTIVDALHFVINNIKTGTLQVNSVIKKHVDYCKETGKKIILLTAHRRESFQGGLTRVFSTIKRFAENHEDVSIIYPYHPNPNVLRAIAESCIGETKNVWLCEPLVYKDLTYVLMAADWVATDSGGLQEEAVSLGKRVLVLRDITERWEGVWDGSEILVGTDQELLYKHMQELYYTNLSEPIPSSMYGDGKACERIVTIIKNILNKSYTRNSQYAHT